MAKFQEDMLFKNVSDIEAEALLEIIGKKSKKVKIMTEELRLFDPSTFRPDIILELDEEIWIIELQSTRVGKDHHKRFLVYVAIGNYRLEEKDKRLSYAFFQQKKNQKGFLTNLVMKASSTMT